MLETMSATASDAITRREKVDETLVDHCKVGNRCMRRLRVPGRVFIRNKRQSCNPQLLADTMHYGAGSVPHTIIELLPQFGSAVYKVAPDTRVVSQMLYSQAP